MMSIPYVRNVIIGIFIFSLSCFADVSDWKSIGPAAGRVSHLVPDPKHSKIWYAINHSELYRSVNAGESWISTGISREKITYLDQLFVHPLTSRVLLNQGQPNNTKIYESRDLGTNFELLSAPSSIRIAQDPLSEPFLGGFVPNYIGTPKKILSSSDGGRTWNNHSPNVPILDGHIYKGCKVFLTYFNDMVISPFQPKAMLVSTSFRLAQPCDESQLRNGIMKSTDLGRTWTVNDGFTSEITFQTDPYFFDRVFVNESHKRSYILTSNGLMPFNEKPFNLVTSYPENKNHLIGQISNELVESFDGGMTWTKTANPFPFDGSFIAMKEPEGALLARSFGGGIYKKVSRNDWKASNRGFKKISRIHDLTAVGNNVYVLLEEGFLYRSTNAGEEWIDLSLDVPHKSLEFETIDVNPFDSKNIILTGHPPTYRPHTFALFVFVSFDGGRSWKNSIKIKGAQFGKIQFHPSRQNVVYLTIGDNLYRSFLKGLNFIKLPLKVDTDELVIDPLSPLTMLFLSCNSIYKSSDGGRTAQRIDTGLEDYELCFTGVSPLNLPDQFLSVDSAGFVRRSLNGGKRWTTISKLPGRTNGHGDFVSWWALFPSDTESKHFYALSRRSSRDFFESSNGGLTWQKIKPLIFNRSSVEEIREISNPLISPLYVATDRGLFLRR